MDIYTGIIPDMDSRSTAGSGPRSPTCPSASMAMEANVALSDLTTSIRQLTVLTSSDCETCTKVNVIVLLNKENIYIGLLLQTSGENNHKTDHFSTNGIQDKKSESFSQAQYFKLNK